MSELARDPNQATILGEDPTQWHARMEGFMAEGARIIVVRGASAANGIEKNAADDIPAILWEYVTDISEAGQPVVLVFDSSADNRVAPDAASVSGRTVDTLWNYPNVTAICARASDSFDPEAEGGDTPMTPRNRPYETYIYDGNLPGGDTALTQSEPLVSYADYEQFIVGATDEDIYERLADLSSKASGREVKVTIVKALLNPSRAIDEELRARLADEQDPTRRDSIQAQLGQRQTLRFGALFTKDGALTDEVKSLPGLRLEVVEGDAHRVERALDRILQGGDGDGLIAFLTNETDGDEPIGVDQRDFHLMTPLFAFAGKGNMVVVKQLLAMGADVNSVFMHQGVRPLTALDGALRSGNNELVALLIEHGAKTGLELRPR